MTTINDLVVQSFREAGTVIVGNSPNTAELTEGLSRFNSYLKSFFGFDIGRNLFDWTAPPSVTAPVYSRYPLKPLNEELSGDQWPYPPPNVRLLTKVTADTTLYFPPAPTDGAQMALADVGSTGLVTLDGNGRLIAGAPTLTDSSPGSLSGKTWFYRADLGNWIELKANFTATDESPLPVEFDELLICGFAIRLSSRYNSAPREGTLAVYRKFLDIARARYSQSIEVPIGPEGNFLSYSGYRRGLRSNIETGGC